MEAKQPTTSLTPESGSSASNVFLRRAEQEQPSNVTAAVLSGGGGVGEHQQPPRWLQPLRFSSTPSTHASHGEDCIDAAVRLTANNPSGTAGIFPASHERCDSQSNDTSFRRDAVSDPPLVALLSTPAILSSAATVAGNDASRDDGGAGGSSVVSCSSTAADFLKMVSSNSEAVREFSDSRK